MRRDAMRATDEIVAALNERRVTLAYELVVDAKNRKIAFYECLMRVWRAEGVFAHSHEIPAERLIVEITETKSSDDRAFVHTLIDLSRWLGLKTVAEWVQDEEAAATLAKWGCDYLQRALIGLATAEPPWLAGSGQAARA